MYLLMILDLWERIKFMHKRGVYYSLGINPFKASFLGQGSFGRAFSIEGDKVLKITTSQEESALSEKIKNGSFKGFVKIYEVRNFWFLSYIVMEKLNTEGVVKQYDRIEPLIGYPYFDKFELLSNVSNRAISEIEIIKSDYKQLGVKNPDIHCGNLGYDNKGSLKAFDIDDRDGK